VSLRALLRKELRWSKHNAAVLIVLLLVLPGTFAYASVAFQHVIPQDAPVAVVPGDESVTEAELDVVDGAAAVFAKPARYGSRPAAMDALFREEVYAVVTVPSGLLNDSRDSRINLTVDGAMTLFDKPSEAMVSVLNVRLSRTLSSGVSVQRTVVGGSQTLAEYLVPILLLGVVLLFAFTYVPYNLASERRAIERVRAEASLESLVASKLLFFTAVMAFPLGVFAAFVQLLNYNIVPLAVGTVLVVVLTFVALTAVSMSIMLLSRFTATGRFVGIVVLFGLFAFGGLIYPAGFFSPFRRTVVRAIPVHYAMITLRGEMLRTVPLSLYTDYVAVLAGSAAAGLVALKGSIVVYRRRE